jgi:hypothetical protein
MIDPGSPTYNRDVTVRGESTHEESSPPPQAETERAAAAVETAALTEGSTGSLTHRAAVEALQRDVGNRAVARAIHEGRTLQRLKAGYLSLDPVEAVGRALADDNESDALELMQRLTTADQANAVLRRFQKPAVKAFGNKTMGAAALILVSKGGSLRDALAWMEDEGTNWTLQQRVIAVASTDQRKGVIGGGWMKWWVKELGNKEMAQLVKMLPLDLATKLRWMHAEGTDWGLMKDVITTSSLPEHRPPLMADDSMRAIFVDECSKSELYDAVKTLGGTLRQQLTWMAIRGCKDDWIKERVGAITDQKQRSSVYYETVLLKRMLDMSDEDRAELAKTLKGTPDELLSLFQNDLAIDKLRGYPKTPGEDWVKAVIRYRKNPRDILWIGSGNPSAWGPFFRPHLWEILGNYHDTLYPEYNVNVFWEAFGDGSLFSSAQIMHFIAVLTGKEPFKAGPPPGKDIPHRPYTAVDPTDATAREFMSILKPGGTSGPLGVSRSELAEGKLGFCYLDKSDPAHPVAFGSLFSDPWILIQVDPSGNISNAGSLFSIGGDPAIVGNTPVAVGLGLTFFQNHVRHEIGHAVGRSKIGSMKMSGNDFALKYGGWKKSSKKDFRNALWSDVPKPGPGWPTVAIVGTNVTLTNDAVRDWCVGVMDGNEPANAIGNAPGDIQAKLNAIQGSLWGAVKLVNYMRSIGKTTVAAMRDNAYQYPGFTPTDPVQIFATRWDDDFVQYDKQAHDNFMGISWYALSSPYEMFAEMYTARYAKHTLPAARGKWDPAQFFAELERQRDPMFGS